ncbi:MAG: ribonuclease HII [Desulfurococcaceae archaeon]
MVKDWKRMPILDIGVDEAGRGPLIGDMVVAGVLADRDLIFNLVHDGLAESKELGSIKRREICYKAVRKGVLIVAVYISPWRIDSENLNNLEAEAIKWIIKVMGSVIGKVNNAEINVYIDEIKGRSHIVKQIIADYLKSKVEEIRVEPDADKNYPVVALASIFAKVLRDSSIRPLKKLFGEFGSGYPSDPRLNSWLKTNYSSSRKPPSFIRRSWSNLSDKAPSWYISKKKTAKHRTLLDFTKR